MVENGVSRSGYSEYIVLYLIMIYQFCMFKSLIGTDMTYIILLSMLFYTLNVAKGCDFELWSQKFIWPFVGRYFPGCGTTSCVEWSGNWCASENYQNITTHFCDIKGRSIYTTRRELNMCWSMNYEHELGDLLFVEKICLPGTFVLVWFKMKQITHKFPGVPCTFFLNLNWES